MKKMNKLLAVVGLVAAMTSGCIETDPTPTGVCQTSYASFTVYNQSGETADLTISGPSAQSDVLLPNQSRTYTLLSGSYSIYGTGRTTLGVLIDSTKTFLCDTAYDVTLTPVQVNPPADPELDLYNDTGEDLDIYVDDAYQNTLLPGQIGLYTLTVGLHSVTVVQVSTGQILYDDIDAPSYYDYKTVYDLHITSTQPIVEIHNNLDLTQGAAAECVVTWVDYDLGFTTPITFDNGLSDVCPAEIGTFSMVRGDHLVEVMGEESEFFYVDEQNGFMEFPENTTTVFDLQ